MRSTQVAAAWVPALFQGPDSQPPSRHKFLKLLVSNNTPSCTSLSPVAKSTNFSERAGASAPFKSVSTKSDESSSGETDSGSAFSSPEAVRPAPHLHADKASGLSDGVQDVLKECQSVMQVLRAWLTPPLVLPMYTLHGSHTDFYRPFSYPIETLSSKCRKFKCPKKHLLQLLLGLQI